MLKADIRKLVAGHLASKGYIPECYAWHIHKPWCDVIVGTEIVRLIMKTRDSKTVRARELARIPRRGPARPLPVHMKDDGGGAQQDFSSVWDDAR